MEASKPRGVTTTAFIALTLGPVLVMCWLGRGRLALLYLAAIMIGAFALGYGTATGMVGTRQISPLHTVADLYFFAVCNLIGLGHGLAIRKTSLARPWFRWIAYASAAWITTVLVFALPITTFLYQPFDTPANSMYPNLVSGDHFFVSKTTYGYSRFSLPFGLAEFAGRTSGRTPARGDLAVFKLPKDLNIDYVKRVIGLPGEEVQITDGIVHINGEPLQQEPVQLDPFYYNETQGMSFLREKLPDGRSYVVSNIGSDGPADYTDVYVVPEGQYFVLGDNRDNSQDSRFEKVGTIPLENFIGPVVYRFWNSRGVPLHNRPEEQP